MQVKSYPQRLYLFLVYGFFILLLLCAFFVYFYLTYSKNVYHDVQLRSDNNSASISSAIETALDNMSSISMSVVYSNAIRQNFVLFSSAEGYVETRPGVQSIYNTIISMIGIHQNVSQVNLYTLDNETVGSGDFQRAFYTALDSKPWYAPTVALNGHKYLTEPIFNATMLAQGENQNTHKFISLTRVFLDRSGQPEGIVEVVQDCHKIFALIPDLRASTPSMTCYVLNERGELVYPYWGEPENMMHLADSQTGFIQLEQGQQAFITTRTIGDYGWTVVILEPKDAVLADLYRFRNSFLMIIVFVVLITMAICFFISHRLTKPLKQLAATVEQLTIDKVMTEPSHASPAISSNIAEIAQLYQSTRIMRERLSESIAEMLLAHEQETKAKLQVTQSLINPHFLYNSLTTISVMAEENMTEDIVIMCQMLCDYFRYTSSVSKMAVSLEEEMKYTEKFILCMKIRFGNDFTYMYDISHEAKQVIIPKLIVQPLVENVFKYAFTATPPWRLKIRAYCSGTSWFVEVEDNGGNLTDEKSRELLQYYRSIRISEELNDLNIGGMGLKNVYLRLKMLYGDEAVFRIESTQKKQTVFVIGGPLLKAEYIFRKTG